MINAVKPKYGIQEEGKVVVRITVNRQGDVINATHAQGSTTLNKDLIARAISAAKKTKFTPKKDAAIQQIGKITYIFLLQ